MGRIIRYIFYLCAVSFLSAQLFNNYFENLLHSDSYFFDSAKRSSIETRFDLFNIFHLNDVSHHALFLKRSQSVHFKLNINALSFSGVYLKNLSSNSVHLKKNNFSLFQYHHMHNYSFSVEKKFKNVRARFGMMLSDKSSYFLALSYFGKEDFTIKYNITRFNYDYKIFLKHTYLSDLYQVPLGNVQHKLNLIYKNYSGEIKYSSADESEFFYKGRNTKNTGKGVHFKFTYKYSPNLKGSVYFKESVNTINSVDGSTVFLKIDQLKHRNNWFKLQFKNTSLKLYEMKLYLDGKESYFEQFSYNIIDFIDPTKYRLRDMQFESSGVILNHTFDIKKYVTFDLSYEHFFSFHSNYLLRERFFITFPLSSYRGEQEDINLNLDALISLKLSKTFIFGKKFELVVNAQQDIPISYSLSGGSNKADKPSGSNSTENNDTLSGGSQFKLSLHYLID